MRCRELDSNIELRSAGAEQDDFIASGAYMGPTRVLFRFLKYIFSSKDLSLFSMPYAWLIHVCVIHTAVCMTLLTYSWHLYLNAKSSQSICVSFGHSAFFCFIPEIEIVENFALLTWHWRKGGTLPQGKLTLPWEHQNVPSDRWVSF